LHERRHGPGHRRHCRGGPTTLRGNAGVVFLIDRATGTALTLTLWDSDAAAKATDQFAEQSRAATVAATGTELIARGSYEVVTRS
jgi:hypothetical protein